MNINQFRFLSDSNNFLYKRIEAWIRIGTAVNGYVACLHQLYLFGAAIQLKRMGYHMNKM